METDRYGCWNFLVGGVREMKLMRGCICSLQESHPSVPTEWNPADKDHRVDVTHYGLRVAYIGAGQSEQDAASARANYPVPCNGIALFYFEVSDGEGREREEYEKGLVTWPFEKLGGSGALILTGRPSYGVMYIFR